MTIIILQQILKMMLLSIIGFFMFRAGKVTREGSAALANILLYLSLPCVIIKGFMQNGTGERIWGLLISFVCALVVLAVSILISRLIFKRDAIAEFSSAFSNCGFFGVALSAVLGEDAVFYMAAFIALLNILQWTYGVMRITKEKSGLSVKKIVTAPFFIAIAIGLILFFTGYQVPVIIGDGVNLVAGLNTPIAMFTIGIYLAQTDIRKMFVKPIL